MPASKRRPRSHRLDRRSASRLTGAIIALLTALSPAALAATIEDVAFDDAIQLDDRSLQLHGLGLLRYRVVFRAYVAGLYLEDASDAKRVLSDVPKRLELSYFWGLEGPQFAAAADELLARNLDAKTLASLRPRIDRMHAAYRDVEPGDRYALTYVPGRGTELALNGTPLALIEGADFAAAYYAIWLGKNALDADFRDTLLAGR